MSGLKIYIYPNLFLQENWGLTTDSVGVATTDHGLVTAANTDHEDFGLVTDNVDSGTEGSLSFEASLAESRAISYNVDSVVITQPSEDYGSVAAAVTTTDDYGSYLGELLNEYSDYGQLNVVNQPFGGISITGSALVESELLKIYDGSGEIVVNGAATFEAITKTDDETLLGTFSGGNQYSEISSYVGLGTLFAVAGGVESRTYDYNIDSIDFFNGYENYGSIEDSTTYDDWGLITSLVGYEGYDDYGFIVNNNQTTYPYGTIVISGALDLDEQPRSFAHLASGEILITGAATNEAIIKTDDETLLGTFSGGNQYSEISSYVGSGSIGIFSGTSDSFGANPPDQAVDITISGSVIEVEVDTYNGSGEILITGAATNEAITKTDDETLLGTFSGGNQYSEISSYVGLGTLFAVAGGVESRTYDYNIDSIDVFAGYENYGLITDSPSYDDWGLITSLVGYEGYDDYGFIVNNNQTTYPYGEINISGALDLDEQPRSFAHLASGEIVVNGAATFEAITKTDDETLLGTFSGTSDPVIFQNGGYTGSGEFSAFGSKVESRGYSYNLDSVYVLDTSEDYGSIFDPVSSADDYGSYLGEIINEYPDYGRLLTNNLVPYGTIVISGSADDATELPIQYNGSGEIVVNGAATFEAITKTDDETLLGTFSGGNQYSEISSYVGSGSIGIFSGTSESITYDYNIDSILLSADAEDYGSVGILTTTILDYGTLTNPTVPTEDYGYIVGGLYPYGTIVISGALDLDEQPRSFAHLASGEIVVSGIASAVENRSFVEDETLLGTFSGGNQYSEISSYVGSGSIGIFSGTSESITYDYNIDSIDVFAGYENYGLITDSPSYEDLGSITIPLVYDDYGFIVNNNQTTYPYGTIVISGALDLDEQPRSFAHLASGEIVVSGIASAVENRSFVEDETLLGTFSGTGLESFVPQTYNGSGEFSAFGSKVESRGYSYNLDSIQVIQSPEDYGSIADPVSSADDYGSYLGVGLTSYQDYGNLSVTQETVNPFGTIVISGALNLDEQIRTFSHLGSGTIGIFSGTAEVVGWNPPDQTVDISISGQAETAVEAEYTPDPGIGTIYVDGSLIERRTYSYNINATSLTYESEDNGLISNTPDVTEIEGGSIASLPTDVGIDYGLISIDQTSLPYGTIVISGAVTNQKAIFTYDGSGTIGIFSGTADSFGVNPPDQTVDVVISGDAATRYEAEYTEVGIGTVNVSGFATDERRTFAHLGSGQIDIGGESENISNVPSPTGGIIDVFGRAGESFIPATHVGIGTGFIDGAKLESRTYIYNETSINAYIVEDNGLIIDPATYEDRGVLSDIVIYEDYGFVFDDKTRVPYDGFIQISGASIDDIDSVYAYNGSGTIGIGASADPVFYTPNYPGIGTITVSGSAQEAKTPATYIGVGTGQFSTIAGSAEVVGWNPPDQTVDITISGVGSEKFTTLQTYSGIGTIGIGGTANPVFYTPNYPGSGVISIGGSANPVYYVPNYPGIGTIFAITGAAEAYGAKPPIVPSDIIISGIGSESYAPGGYTGIGTIVISGAGIGVSNPYRAPFVYVTII